MEAELTTLVTFLDSQRSAVLRPIEGLPDDVLRRSMLPSGWTFLGMLQHLTVNERYWLRWAVGGESIPGTAIVDGRCQVVLDDMADVENDWLVAPHLAAETVLARYREEIEKCNAAIAAVSLDGPPRQRDPVWDVWFPTGGPVTIRWIVLHMIEETAQHAGHLDAARELYDSHAGTGD